MTYPTFSDGLDHVLNQSKYKHFFKEPAAPREISPEPSAFARFLENLANKIANLFGNSRDPLNLSALKIILMIVLVAIGAFILFLIVKKIHFHFSINTPTKKPSAVVIKTVNSLLEKGAQFAANGQYREAIRYQFLGLLDLLNKKNVIHFNDKKTNSQLIKELSAAEFKQIQPFSKVSHGFNYAWYGHKTIDSQNYDIWLQNFDLVAQEVKDHVY